MRKNKSKKFKFELFCQNTQCIYVVNVNFSFSKYKNYSLKICKLLSISTYACLIISAIDIYWFCQFDVGAFIKRNNIIWLEFVTNTRFPISGEKRKQTFPSRGLKSDHQRIKMNAIRYLALYSTVSVSPLFVNKLMIPILGSIRSQYLTTSYFTKPEILKRKANIWSGIRILKPYTHLYKSAHAYIKKRRHTQTHIHTDTYINAYSKRTLGSVVWLPDILNSIAHGVLSKLWSYPTSHND